MLTLGNSSFARSMPRNFRPASLCTRSGELVEKHDLKLLIIDSLNGFLNAMPGEQFLAMQLHELLGYLSSKRRHHDDDSCPAWFCGTNYRYSGGRELSGGHSPLVRYFEAAGEVGKRSR